MIGLPDFCTRLLRIVLVTLMLVTWVSSAAAEARCAMTVVSPQEDSNVSQVGEAVAAEDRDSKEDGQAPFSSPFHCAFSHACHGIAAPAGPAIQRQVHVARSPYSIDAFSPLGTIEPANAERPPQA